MKSTLTLAVLCFCMSTLLGCTASEAQCDALGDHYVKLAGKEAEAKGVPADLIKTVAEEGKTELVGKCKTERPLASEVDCLLKADSFDGFKACEE